METSKNLMPQREDADDFPKDRASICGTDFESQWCEFQSDDRLRDLLAGRTLMFQRNHFAEPSSVRKDT